MTAVFAGLLTKVGVYAMIRSEPPLFPGGPVTGPPPALALLTMVVGILGAVAQSRDQRLLSFTLVSHIGFMLFGIGLAGPPGLAAAIFDAVHHTRSRRRCFWRRGWWSGAAAPPTWTGLGRSRPASRRCWGWCSWCSRATGCIPRPPELLGKVGLLQAGVAHGGPLAWTLVARGLVTSLLTLYAVARV